MLNKGFSVFDVFVAFGILQGLICSVFLFRSKTLSKRILGCTLIVFSLLSFKIQLHTLGLWDNFYFRYFPLAVDLLIQPLLFLYACALTKPDFNISRKTLLHFLPCSIFMLHAVIVYGVTLGAADPAQKDHIADAFYFNDVKKIEDYLSAISSIAYWTLGYLTISRYQQWLFKNIADTCYPTFAWLKNMLILLGIFVLALLVNLSLDTVLHFGRNHFGHWQLFYIYISLLIYYLGFTGFQQPEIRWAVPSENPPGDPPRDDLFGEAEKFLAKNAIIQSLEQDRVFTNPELTLSLLAQQLSLPENLISVTINTCFQKNFRNLINEYRVNEVKQKMTDTRYKHLSLFGIALESGFNSEASFYRAFKKYTGHSPKEYLNITVK